MLEDMDDILEESLDFHADTHDLRNEQGDLLEVLVHDNSLECYIHII